MKRKWLYSGLIILVVSTAVYCVFRYIQYQQANAQMAGLKTAEITQGTITTSVQASGTVRASQSSSLAWQTSGTVKAVKVQVGDTVGAGQVLAELDPGSVSQDLLAAQANLETAQKNLEDILSNQTTTAKARQNLADAQNALDDYTTNFSLTQANAKVALIEAQDTLTSAIHTRDALISTQANSEDLTAANLAYVKALVAVNTAQQNYDQVKQWHIAQDDDRWHSVTNALIYAKAQLSQAFTQLNTLMSLPDATEIAAADAKVADAQAALEQAQYNWDQVKDGQNTTQLALLQAQLADAQRAYERVKDGPDESDVLTARAKVAAAQAVANQFAIKAPFAGTVTEVDAITGGKVSSGSSAFRIDDLSQRMVDVQVSEVDIARIQTGQTVSLSFDAIEDKTYTGKVTQVAMVGTSSQGVVQYQVTVTMSDADAEVLPGLTAALNIATESRSNVLIVPSRAVHMQNGQRYILLLANDRQVQVPVTVGLTDDTRSQITPASSVSELKEGEKVIIN